MHGATDDLGYHAAEDKTTVYDLWATVLHQLGMDHEKLTYRYGGSRYATDRRAWKRDDQDPSLNSNWLLGIFFWREGRGNWGLAEYTGEKGAGVLASPGPVPEG